MPVQRSSRVRVSRNGAAISRARAPPSWPTRRRRRPLAGESEPQSVDDPRAADHKLVSIGQRRLLQTRGNVSHLGKTSAPACRRDWLLSQDPLCFRPSACGSSARSYLVFTGTALPVCAGGWRLAGPSLEKPTASLAPGRVDDVGRRATVRLASSSRVSWATCSHAPAQRLPMGGQRSSTTSTGGYHGKIPMGFTFGLRLNQESRVIDGRRSTIEALDRDRRLNLRWNA